MELQIPIWRRFSALLVLAALPTLSATIPVLDVVVGDGRPAVETRHHPGTHGYPHNHLICIQQQANQWAPSFDAPLLPLLAATRAPASVVLKQPVRSTQILLPRPRGPPPG